MTSHEPTLPLGNRVFHRPPSRTASQTFHQTPPRSWPRQNITQTPNAPASPRDVSEPAFKKQKVDDTARSLGRGSGREIAELSFDQTIGTRAALPVVAADNKIDNDSKKEPRIHQPPLLPRRPVRDSCRTTPHHGRALAIERAARRDVVLTKPYVPEPPSFAPRFHDAGPADFFPWAGNHPEDALNELTTKSGFFDKLQNSQSETATARGSVWSSLKHKSGLQILSSLFVSALDQRQAHGTITATSTFKPPPRVTLTDTKREAWLRDLANPSIPLRRLSRTIPHGIRGKILLDHCLSKGIPTLRAVWLAKCVGANEIRAFKRKGTGGVFTVGGEAKWIKDWTINVEQFLEGIIATCGTSEWRAKIDYGLRLASHLYWEHLLDQDQYLNWVTSSLRDCDLDTLPIWLLVTQIHQQELLQHRQRGKLLAEAVLGHLQKASLSSTREIYGAVLGQITRFVKTIMHLAPWCFLLPGRWDEYQELVRECLNDDELRLLSCFETLSKRNANLRKRSPGQKGQLQSTCRDRIIDQLDRLYTDHNFAKIAGACLRLTHNHDLLVRTCVEWSASSYRYGLFRTYAAARLLRIWSRRGVELQQPILNFLTARPNPVGSRKPDVYKLLAELISSKHLSVGKYLQWLMARGTLLGRPESLRDGPCDVSLLFELPLQGLASHVLNLRQTLLSSLGVSHEHESNMVDTVKAKLADQIPDFFPPQSTTQSSATSDIDYSTLSQTIKSSIARWIRQTLILRLQVLSEASSDAEDHNRQIVDSVNSRSDLITLGQFQALRSIFEEIGEFAVLADFLNLLSTEVQGSVLTAVADTINHYFDIFDAIGAADDLFQNLCHQQEDAPGHELIEKGFLEALVDLGCRLPRAAQEIPRLRKELSMYAPKPSAAACSPISDTMVEAIQSSEPAFADEMDQVLTNGTTMDDPTLSRVFTRIIAQLEKSVLELEYSILRFSQILVRLRGFGPKTFDILLLERLQSWLQSDSRPKLSRIVPPMVCSKIVSLRTVVNAIAQNLNSEGSQRHRTLLALDALDLVAEAHCEGMLIVDYRRYRFLDQLHRLERTAPTSLLTIVGVVIQASTSTDMVTQSQAKRHVESSAVRSLLRNLLLRRHGTRKGAEEALGSFFLDANTLNVVGGLLHKEHVTSSDSGLSTKILKLLDDISDFNMPLARVELKTVLDSAVEPPEVSNRILSEILIKRARTSTAGRIELWACLVSELSMSQAAAVREKAESELLSRALRDMTSISSENRTGDLHLIVEAAAFSVPYTETSPILDQISDGLATLVASSQLEKHQLDRPETDPLFQFIDVILRLLTIHQTTIQHPKFSQNTLYQIIMPLALLLIHPLLTSHLNLSNQLSDVLSLLSDSLSDDNRSRCIRALRDYHQTRDPRLRFIFGYAETVEKEWLQLVTKSTSPAETKAEGAAATTTSTLPYPLRRWEMMQDATPVATENDTSLSLTLFGARKSVL